MTGETIAFSRSALFAASAISILTLGLSAAVAQQPTPGPAAPAKSVRPIAAMGGLGKDLKDLVKKGAALATKMRCASCHLPSLVGQKQMPRLARQRVDYLFDAMKAFRDKCRAGADAAMTAVIVGASDEDLLALAHYASAK